MRDKIAQIISDKYQYGSESLAAAVDAIIDALPSGVVPLVWTMHSPDDQPYWSANGYKIQSMPRDTWQFIGRSYIHIDEAKAAANAHHVAQVMKAFGVYKEVTN